jgi:NAD-dependent dihydropyrimidine dehydrogenase PreA subunit
MLEALSQGGAEVEVVPDLCGLAASRDVRLQGWAESRPLSVVACYPRAIRWLFHAAGASLPAEQVRFFNARTQSADQIVSALLGDRGQGTPGKVQMPAKEDGWIPWFPVIDYDRCKNCKQCLNFCLFGVYTLSQEGRVEVTRPSHCKTNCPACARACPQQAILFPKYGQPPINGAEVGPTEAADIGRLLQGGLHEALRHRDAVRKQLDIPADVLASLSPADLRRIGQGGSAGGPADPAGQGGENRA